MFNPKHMYPEAPASRTLRVSKGLFVLRYVSSKANSGAPSVSVVAKPGSGVDVITQDGSGSGFLNGVGEAIVVRASRDSFIHVNVMPLRPGASQDAHLQLERISSSPAGVEGGDAEHDAFVAPSYLASVSPKLEIVAHVAMRGDMAVAAGEWLCGPKLPMAIEGLRLNWLNKPATADIITTGTILSRGKMDLPAAATGSFIGTRGKSTPLVGLNLTIVGPRADDFTLTCEALFLGSSLYSQQGGSIDVCGPTGLEPLVGLRLSLNSVAESLSPGYSENARTGTVSVPDAPARMPELPVNVQNGRVRVFRTPRSKSPLLRH